MNIGVRMSVLARGICEGTSVENRSISFTVNTHESLRGNQPRTSPYLLTLPGPHYQ